MTEQQPVTLTPARLDQIQARANERGITVLEQVERALDHEASCRYDRLIPVNARVRPGYWLCRLRRHHGVLYHEATEPTATGGTVSWISEARCLTCGRAQPGVHVTFPHNYTLGVEAPPPDDQADDHSEPERGAAR